MEVKKEYFIDDNSIDISNYTKEEIERFVQEEFRDFLED